MNDHHSEEQTHEIQERAESPERDPSEPPRIYVASLSDYNAGRLHGAWIDANQEDEDIAADVRAMLERSPEPIAEEWAIHDYEGFGPLRLAEYENLGAVGKVGRGIALQGPAYAHWAAIVGADDTEGLDRFEDVYLGHYDDLHTYAEELLDEFGAFDLVENAIPQLIGPYVNVDVDGFARDLELSGDVTTSEGEGGVYVFDQNR